MCSFDYFWLNNDEYCLGGYTHVVLTICLETFSKWGLKLRYCLKQFLNISPYQ